MDSIKELKQAVELIQKPFELDPFLDLIEDKGILAELKKMGVSIEAIKVVNPTHDQISRFSKG